MAQSEEIDNGDFVELLKDDMDMVQWDQQ